MPATAQGGRVWQPFCEGKNADKNPEGWAEWNLNDLNDGRKLEVEIIYVAMLPLRKDKQWTRIYVSAKSREMLWWVNKEKRWSLALWYSGCLLGKQVKARPSDQNNLRTAGPRLYSPQSDTMISCYIPMKTFLKYHLNRNTIETICCLNWELEVYVCFCPFICAYILYHWGFVFYLVHHHTI